jgi:hypothetical protein
MVLVYLVMTKLEENEENACKEGWRWRLKMGEERVSRPS